MVSYPRANAVGVEGFLVKPDSSTKVLSIGTLEYLVGVLPKLERLEVLVEIVIDVPDNPIPEETWMRFPFANFGRNFRMKLRNLTVHSGLD